MSIIAWPAVVVIIVLLLRSSMSKLAPSLSRLKYKDLELEFEREQTGLLQRQREICLSRQRLQVPQKSKNLIFVTV